MKPFGIPWKTHQIGGAAPVWSNLATHPPYCPLAPGSLSAIGQAPSATSQSVLSDRSDRFPQSATRNPSRTQSHPVAPSCPLAFPLNSTWFHLIPLNSTWFHFLTTQAQES
jgi:hypothetical protein